MCGIIGMFTTEPSERYRNLFLAALILNEERGKDSTGVLAYRFDKDEVDYVKAVGKPTEFVKARAEYIGQANVYIGHARHATHGAVNEDNAHPFRREGVGFAHNGVITNASDLAKVYDMKYQVDSETLLPIIKDGFQLLPHLEGTANFVAYDEEDKVAYVSTKDNPLFCYVNNDIILYSSVSINFDLLPKLAMPWLVSKVRDRTLITINPETLEVASKHITYESKYSRQGSAYGGYSYRERDYDEYGFAYSRVRGGEACDVDYSEADDDKFAEELDDTPLGDRYEFPVSKNWLKKLTSKAVKYIKKYPPNSEDKSAYTAIEEEWMLKMVLEGRIHPNQVQGADSLLKTLSNYLQLAV